MHIIEFISTIFLRMAYFLHMPTVTSAESSKMHTRQQAQLCGVHELCIHIQAKLSKDYGRLFVELAYPIEGPASRIFYKLNCNLKLLDHYLSLSEKNH
jgi:hypothetical protein